MKTKRNLNTLIALTGALIVSVLPTGRADDKTKTSDNKVQLMFVQTADDLKADGTTLRLVNVGQQTLYFSDRPARVAGHLTMPAYMDEWKAGEGPDNFSSDPPNATLSVYESGNQENTLAVVKISHPVIDGKDLVYSYKLIEGTMPKAGGAAALFIDWIGAGRRGRGRFSRRRSGSSRGRPAAVSGPVRFRQQCCLAERKGTRAWFRAI